MTERLHLPGPRSRPGNTLVAPRAPGPGCYPGATRAGMRELVHQANEMEVTMSTTEIQSGRTVEAPEPGTVDYKLEVMVLPVSDVDRAKAFYASMGWREDADFPIRDGFRVIQMTPPGSQMTAIFCARLTPAQPGSYEGLVLSVYDIEAAHADLLAKGIDVSE